MRRQHSPPLAHGRAKQSNQCHALIKSSNVEQFISLLTFLPWRRGVTRREGQLSRASAGGIWLLHVVVERAVRRLRVRAGRAGRPCASVGGGSKRAVLLTENTPPPLVPGCYPSRDCHPSLPSRHRRDQVKAGQAISHYGPSCPGAGVLPEEGVFTSLSSRRQNVRG